MPLAFDEAGHPVAVSDPVYETADDTQDDPRSDFQEKLATFLEWLAAGATVEQAGRKAICSRIWPENPAAKPIRNWRGD